MHSGSIWPVRTVMSPWLLAGADAKKYHSGPMSRSAAVPSMATAVVPCTP
jgi:hypothetical protein